MLLHLQTATCCLDCPAASTVQAAFLTALSQKLVAAQMSPHVLSLGLTCPTSESHLCSSHVPAPRRWGPCQNPPRPGSRALCTGWAKRHPALLEALSAPLISISPKGGRRHQRPMSPCGTCSGLCSCSRPTLRAICLRVCAPVPGMHPTVSLVSSVAEVTPPALGVGHRAHRATMPERAQRERRPPDQHLGLAACHPQMATTK